MGAPGWGWGIAAGTPGRQPSLDTSKLLSLVGPILSARLGPVVERVRAALKADAAGDAAEPVDLEAAMQPLLRELAAEGEAQTRRRMEFEKRGPDGTPWPEWSPGYAATRHGGQSLLDATGALIQSITAFADRQTAGWGTNVIYAATHQFGRGGIPARPFLGVSDEDERALLDIAERWIDRMLGA